MYEGNCEYTFWQQTPVHVCTVNSWNVMSLGSATTQINGEFLVHCDVSRTKEGLPFSQIIQVSSVLSSTGCTQNNLKFIMNYRLVRMLKEGPVCCYTEPLLPEMGQWRKLGGSWRLDLWSNLRSPNKEEAGVSNGKKGEGKGFRLPRPVCR